MIRRGVLAIAVAVVGGLAAGQLAAGELVGHLVDPDGKAVERLESAITVTDAAGRSFSGKVSRDGSYRISALPAGTLASSSRARCRATGSHGCSVARSHGSVAATACAAPAEGAPATSGGGA